MNFAAVSSGLGMASGKLVAAAMSADMLAMVRCHSSYIKQSSSMTCLILSDNVYSVQ